MFPKQNIPHPRPAVYLERIEMKAWEGMGMGRIYIKVNLNIKIREDMWFDELEAAWLNLILVQRVEGLTQNYSNSIANALELLRSCTKPPMLPRVLYISTTFVHRILLWKKSGCIWKGHLENVHVVALSDLYFFETWFFPVK